MTVRADAGWHKRPNVHRTAAKQLVKACLQGSPAVEAAVLIHGVAGSAGFEFRTLQPNLNAHQAG